MVYKGVEIVGILEEADIIRNVMEKYLNPDMTKVEVLEKELIIKAMKSNNWVIARTARQLDVPDRILTYKINKYHIQGVFENI